MLVWIKPLPAPIDVSQPRSLPQHFDAKFAAFVAALRPQRGFQTRSFGLNKMIGIVRTLSSFSGLSKPIEKSFLSLSCSMCRSISSFIEDPRLNDFLDYMEKLKNYERVGVPKDAGTDSVDGFDLGRMRRLLQRLGNPQSHFKAIHIAGTKGKGSTAAFLSNILREEGFHVGCYTSPHLFSIRERICLGRNGNPVSAEELRNLFCDVRGILDLSIETEAGSLSHFEVFTALAFTLFSQQNVDVAIIEKLRLRSRDVISFLANGAIVNIAHIVLLRLGLEVVIGGPFEPQIEHIIREKAFSLNAPVVSAFDAGSQSSVRCFERDGEVPFQLCKIFIENQDDISMFLHLPEVKLQMLGEHQLWNAISATCTALCLRNQGWRLSDKSIQTGLEKTWLPGRGQYLTKREVEKLGLCGVSILVDGAHTEASAKGLTDIMKIEDPDGIWAFVVSMASDKDHIAFARQLLSEAIEKVVVAFIEVGFLVLWPGLGRRPEAVILTESTIAGGKSRTASAKALKEVWLVASKLLEIDAADMGSLHQWKNDEFPIVSSRGDVSNRQVLMVACQNNDVQDSIQLAGMLLHARAVEKHRFIVVTGSLHIVSSVLAAVKH
ncbi:Folylpolyglutamate synthase [Apostasia shenzhenica]|uniref:Folylpolyglutamate synthase n=1 Tax=Apostasia shenzhenica TaxID=1088818 RepID=A0A2I0AE37_9ASPA|nr:Folylpolyglutamate synthase [Apostasia shenzhenica]